MIQIKVKKLFLIWCVGCSVLYPFLSKAQGINSNPSIYSLGQDNESWKYQLILKKLPLDINRYAGAFFSPKGFFFSLSTAGENYKLPLCYIQKVEGSKAIDIETLKVKELPLRIVQVTHEEDYQHTYSFENENKEKVNSSVRGILLKIVLSEFFDNKSIKNSESLSAEVTSKGQIEVSCVLPSHLKIKEALYSELEPVFRNYFQLKKIEIKKSDAKFNVTHSEFLLEKPFVSNVAVITIPSLPIDRSSRLLATRFAKENIIVRLDGIQQRVLDVSYRPLPLKYHLHIDVSGSMSDFYSTIIDQTLRFTENVISRSKGSIFSATVFSGEKAQLMCDPTFSVPKFMDCLKGLKMQDDKTPLWKTLTQVLNLLSGQFRTQVHQLVSQASSFGGVEGGHSLPRVPVIVTFTDGLETQMKNFDSMSESDRDGLSTLFAKKMVPLHFVMFSNHKEPLMYQVAQKSNGSVTHYNSGYSQIYQKVLNSIPTIHDIQIQATGENGDGRHQIMSLDGRERNLSVDIQNPNIRFLHRSKVVLKDFVRKNI